MTEKEAVDAAVAFTARLSFRGVSFHSVQRISPDQLPVRLRTRNVFWIVRFQLPADPGVVDSAGLLLIEVDDVSGATSITPSL
jgi:hypothetical protein